MGPEGKSEDDEGDRLCTDNDPVKVVVTAASLLGLRDVKMALLIAEQWRIFLVGGHGDSVLSCEVVVVS